MEYLPLGICINILRICFLKAVIFESSIRCTCTEDIITSASFFSVPVVVPLVMPGSACSLSSALAVFAKFELGDDDDGDDGSCRKYDETVSYFFCLFFWGEFGLDVFADWTSFVVVVAVAAVVPSSCPFLRFLPRLPRNCKLRSSSSTRLAVPAAILSARAIAAQSCVSDMCLYAGDGKTFVHGLSIPILLSRTMRAKQWSNMTGHVV